VTNSPSADPSIHAVALVPCDACGHEVSPDAPTCPHCGHASTWVNPKLARVVDHLNGLARVTRYEVAGNRMVLVAQTRNIRQSVGAASMSIAMVLLVLGVFVPFLLGIAVACLIVGLLLTAGGLNASSRHELHIDLRRPGGVIGKHDPVFWADVLRIIQEPVATERTTPPTTR
jgi:hypothetical protein